MYPGPVEVDETYIGGKRKNMPRSKRKHLKGRGGVGKAVVIGMKDSASSQVTARKIDATDTEFAGRHNCRDADTIEITARMARAMRGKRLSYSQLISDA